MIKNLNKTAFSLLEILLSAVIFLISVAGIFATLNAVRVPVANKENQLAAAVFGKQVSEALYSQVMYSGTYYTGCAGGANPCPDFDLSVGTHQVSPGTLQTKAGLIWPQALKASNSCPGVANSCLIYIITCADNSPGPGCTNTNIPHAISLQINWPQSS